ncbi:MAG TPA: hypothetical protein VF490_04345 [Chryseosolibacter sp.]
MLRPLLWTQATYIMVTAIWPLVDIASFMYVTGEKTDVWLVKTVGALLVPVAACLYTHLFIETDHRPALVLGSLTAVAFISIDFYYALTDVISDIYLADGILEIMFVVGWVCIARARRSRRPETLR